MAAVAVTPEPALLALTIDTVEVDGLISCDLDSILEMGETTADSETARTRSYTIKDGNVSFELLEDATDAGQVDVQDDYDTPASSTYVLTRGSKTFTFIAWVTSIKHTGGPADLQKTSVTLAVDGGIATT